MTLVTPFVAFTTTATAVCHTAVRIMLDCHDIKTRMKGLVML